MRYVSLLAVALLAGTLASCCSHGGDFSGSTGANSVRYAAYTDRRLQSPKKPQARSHHSNSEDTEIAPTTGSAEPVLPFTPEWYARENEIDARIKRIMKICSGC